MVDVITQAQAEDTVLEGEVVAAEELASQAKDSVDETVTAAEETPSLKESKEWDDLLDEPDSDDLTGIPEREDAEEPVEEDAPAEIETPEEKPGEESKPVEEVPEEVEVPTAPDVEVPIDTPDTDTRTPEEVQTELSKVRTQARDDLVAQFSWTEEQTNAFEENPGVVLSEMAADIFLDLYDSLTQGLHSQLPGMMRGAMAQEQSQVKYDQTFYNAWPQLAKTEYKATIDRLAKAYHQENPGVAIDSAVKEIGAQAWVALRLPLEDLVAQTQGVAPAPAISAISTPTHVPAGAGNSPVRAVRQPGNDYEQLADEFILDD